MLIDYFNLFEAGFWLASLYSIFIITFISTYFNVLEADWVCWFARLPSLDSPQLCWQLYLLPQENTFLFPLNRYIDQWSCLVILLTFFLYLWLTSFLSAGGLLSQYSSSCCRKKSFQSKWNENIYGKKRAKKLLSKVRTVHNFKSGETNNPNS